MKKLTWRQALAYCAGRADRHVYDRNGSIHWIELADYCKFWDVGPELRSETAHRPFSPDVAPFTTRKPKES
jgi:hypothetical protein